jgi:hypothetical protein
MATGGIAELAHCLPYAEVASSISMLHCSLNGSRPLCSWYQANDYLAVDRSFCRTPSLDLELLHLTSTLNALTVSPLILDW